MIKAKYYLMFLGVSDCTQAMSQKLLVGVLSGLIGVNSPKTS